MVRQFLKDELLEPLGMADTDFYVPAEKQDRFVTCYRRVPDGLIIHDSLHLAVGRYDRLPAFESGGIPSSGCTARRSRSPRQLP